MQDLQHDLPHLMLYIISIYCTVAHSAEVTSDEKYTEN
jgi:hypothetical protein